VSENLEQELDELAEELRDPSRADRQSRTRERKARQSAGTTETTQSPRSIPTALKGCAEHHDATL
jgi:hypothetical protein